ncbi:hypothetical protein [Terribacillus saccharophilus]|uniref:hypothetical protein n=1 Tax=Terribacillus saccharophilus TaxID=361277 RepID=UPI000BA79190|nr:hypothetical protein [Terribacillus saccharophilus]PAF19100.1 hypothetical protein CHH51_04360 [Terribacillus saccharophilus]
MKLIGSKTEQDLRDLLKESNESLFNDNDKTRLLTVLRNQYPEMKSAYIIHWIPEQGEDIYRILINDSIISEIEIDRLDEKAEPINEAKSFNEYKQGLNKQNQLKLAVAIDLARHDMKY